MGGRLAAITVLMTLMLAAPAAATQRLAAPLPAGSTSDIHCNPTPCELRRAIVDVGNEGDEVVVMPGVYDQTTIAPGLISIPAGMDVHGQAGAPRPLVTRGATADSVLMVQNGASVRHLVVRSDSNFARPVAPSGDSVLQEDLVLVATGDNGTAAQVANEGVLRDTVAYAPGANGKGIAFGTGGTADVRNVTALAPGAQGSGIFGRTNSSGACQSPPSPSVLSVENTIVLGGGKDIALMPDATCPDKYPLEVRIGFSSYRTTSVVPFGTVTDTGANQSAMPLLTADNHEAPGSPTIDAGTPGPLLGLTDLDGDARTQGPAPDIGADETANPPASSAASTGGGPSASSSTTTGGQAALPPVLPGTCTLGAIRAGKATVEVLVECTTAVTGTLRGELAVKSRKRKRARRAAIKRYPAGSATVAGQRATLRLKLVKRARRALKKAGKGTLRLTLAVTDASGAAISATASKRVRAPRPRP